MVSKTFIEGNRKKLENDKETIKEQINQLEASNADQNNTVDLQEIELESRMEDQAVRESNSSMINDLKKQLHAVESALERVKTGEYGICRRCGKEISENRLTANPSAVLCLECAAAEERNEED